MKLTRAPGIEEYTDFIFKLVSKLKDLPIGSTAGCVNVDLVHANCSICCWSDGYSQYCVVVLYQLRVPGVWVPCLLPG